MEGRKGVGREGGGEDKLAVQASFSISKTSRDTNEEWLQIKWRISWTR